MDATVSMVLTLSGVALFNGLGAWAIKGYISSISKNMKEHCGTVSGNVIDGQKKASDERKEIWAALHGHGHKGLEGNGNKVTR